MLTTSLSSKVQVQTMQITYKFRLYPTTKQQLEIGRQLEICRRVYNQTLSSKNEHYENTKKTLTLYDTQKELKTWKLLDKDLLTVHSQVLQATQGKVEIAFHRFFQRLKTAKPGEKFGFPKPKEEGRLRSLIYPQSGFKFLPRHIKLSKIGKIKAVFHRKIGGKVKRVSLVKYPSDKYFLCINTEVDIVPQEPLADSMSKSVGIDLGMNHFAVLSDGKVFDSTKPLKAAKKSLAKIDRLNKPKALAQERVANRRSDFLHKLANKLVQAYDIISVENLDVKGMQTKKPGFSKDFRRAIADNGWSIFINMLQYKAVIAGKRVVLVDPAFTSQDCSQCGSRQKLDLSERTYNCPTCGLYLCRDANAARNILRLGMQSLGENP